MGVDFVEFDIQRSRDGRLVLLHDERVDRTTNGTGRVSGLTWEELQLLDAGDGERIPSLEAALAAASGHAGVMLEAKTPGTGRQFTLPCRRRRFRVRWSMRPSCTLRFLKSAESTRWREPLR